MARYSQIGSHKTTVKANMSRGTLRVTYHSTDVVNVTPKSITLNTGGHFTNTTKLRMNQASRQYGLGYYVYQKKGKWYVQYRGKTHNFRGRSIRLKR